MILGIAIVVVILLGGYFIIDDMRKQRYLIKAIQRYQEYTDLYNIIIESKCYFYDELLKWHCGIVDNKIMFLPHRKGIEYLPNREIVNGIIKYEIDIDTIKHYQQSDEGIVLTLNKKCEITLDHRFYNGLLEYIPSKQFR